VCRASLLQQAMVFKDRVKRSSFCMFIDCTDGWWFDRFEIGGRMRVYLVIGQRKKVHPLWHFKCENTSYPSSFILKSP